VGQAVEGTAVSVKVSAWVWHEARDRDGSEVAGNELVLMLALADVADDSGRCRFVDEDTGLTYEALAEKVRVSKRTVIRMVAALREAGLIDVVKGVKGRPNEFRVLISATAKSGDNLAPNDDETGPDSVTTATDSVTTEAGFGDNGDTRSSYPRVREADVSTSGPSTLGQRFAQPLCEVLVGELIRNEVKYPDPMSKRWLDAARLLVDVDKRDPHQAKTLIEWACRDGFWRANILSMPTFREQYDKLRLARERATGKPSTMQQGRNVDERLRALQAAGDEPRAIGA
jgi:DNA-binding Lrp family transcriptional regulator